jgi:nucleolar protein 56
MRYFGSIGIANNDLESRNGADSRFPSALHLLPQERMYVTNYEEFTQEDLNKAQLGLAHSFSRNKIALDVNREDKPIIQSICLLELLDKDVNTLSMRIREWFSWHFPELSKLISDNFVFTRLAYLIEVLQRTI